MNAAKIVITPDSFNIESIKPGDSESNIPSPKPLPQQDSAFPVSTDLGLAKRENLLHGNKTVLLLHSHGPVGPPRQKCLFVCVRKREGEKSKDKKGTSKQRERLNRNAYLRRACRRRLGQEAFVCSAEKTDISIRLKKPLLQ